MFNRIFLIVTLVALTSCASVSNSKNEISKATDRSNEHRDDGQSLEKYLAKAMVNIDSMSQVKKSHLADEFYIKGSDAALRGDSLSAALFFEKVLQINGKDDYVSKRYAVELIRLNKLSEAKVILQDLYKSETSENVGLILAGVHTALKEKRAAQIVYNSLLENYPKSEEACVFLAKSYSLESKFKKAYRLLSKCEKENKGKAIYSFYRGKIDLARGQRKSALKYFKKSLAIDETYQQSAIALGSIYEEDQKYDKALLVYEKFLKKTPHSYSILKSVIQIYFSQGKYDKVIPHAEALSNIDPSDLNLKVRLGILYADSKKYEDAKGVFKEILTVIPQSDKVLYYLGMLYKETDEYDSAVGYFSKVPEESSLFHESNLEIARLLLVEAEEDETGESAKKFVSFVEQASSKGVDLKIALKVMLAGHYETIGRVPAAVDEMEEIQNEKEFSESHEYYLAALHEKNGDYNKAKDVIEKLLSKNPENPHALNFLGYTLLEKGDDLDRAYILIKKAVSLKPKDGYIRDSLGWYYYKTGNYEKALVEIKKAWSLVKTDVIVTKHLAMVYKKLKKYELAKKFYVEALRNCKVDSERQEVMRDLSGLESLRLPASSQ
ncbi:tetratricopeptide repeat protein [Halobacteriovorax sp. HLS]|uniref:tetratricopeptide repeat protein n=1 Tax=Halobacteriovorax sp. HLS TaxID=2234000 RepID=UPI000FD8566E|nr:tetratricopeptide repeat protein [Halobacteriovorax sp. HLS]